MICLSASQTIRRIERKVSSSNSQVDYKLNESRFKTRLENQDKSFRVYGWDGQVKSECHSTGLEVEKARHSWKMLKDSHP
ncbi:hypothetical protein CEXT_190571 [Caerostris extrusa]|uniref:Uncharacterized protein n=1 Tax=Caerostris extrusa TaxID=172846 RepID=A0AAV4MHU0_CAEEX|nr:hypothetical protein CEXT_190571 [Caerostris extrusa]